MKNTGKALLSLRNITKSYPGVIALDNFSIDFLPGETHAIVGENGAGKSTLIKVISGAIKPDRGEIQIDESRYDAMYPLMARQLGIEVIYQEFNLVGTLSVAENIFLGRNKGKFVNYRAMNAATTALLREFELEMDPSALIRDLSPAQQQVVEIIKAISKNARLIVMDEPTAPLSMKEVEMLFQMIRKMKENQVTIIYISHRLEEIFEVADRVTVMRDGEHISTQEIEATTKHALVQAMVGRELVETYPTPNARAGSIALEAENISGNGCRDVSFAVRHGEVLGVAGLVGAGRTELMRVVYGADKMDGGTVFVDGNPVRIRCPGDAIHNGIGLIPEDRKNQGCFLGMDVPWNVSLMNIRKLCKHGILRYRLIEENSERFIRKLQIKVPETNMKVANLSGGNQQKVALAKTLASDCNILIFDEPTRGIDVGAKQEIYLLMRSLANEGHAIIMISSDMEELLGMSDRLVVIRDGQLAAEMQKDEFSQVKVLEYASGMVS